MKCVLLLILIFTLEAKALLPLNPVGPKQFPSSVAIKIEPLSSNCTAVKVGEKTFLTAAHCLELLKRTQNQRVILYRMNKDRYAVTEITPQNLKITLHPNYYRQETAAGTVRNFIRRDNADIALLTIDILTPEIPVQKISMTTVKPGQKIVVGGFGVDQNTCHNYDRLPCRLNMRSQVITNVEKNLFYSKPSLANPAYLTPGDSGGPVYSGGFVVGVNVLGFPSLTGAIGSMLGGGESTDSASGYLYLKNYAAWLSENLRLQR